MSDSNDSSLLFSLQALEQMEKERILNQQEAIRSAELAAERRQAEVEEQRRLQAAARAKAAEAQSVIENSRRSAERARLEGIRLGYAERARLDSERELTLKRSEQANAHREQLLRIEADSKRYRISRVMGLVVAMAVVVAGGIWGTAAVGDSKDMIDDGRRALSIAQMELSELRGRLADEQSVRERDAVQVAERKATEEKAARDPARSPRKKTVPAARGRRNQQRRPTAPPPRAEACVDDGDPMNGCY